MNGELDTTRIDSYFARFMSRLAGTDDEALRTLFAGLSSALANQHSCIDLDTQPRAAVLKSMLASLPVVGNGRGPTPLVLEGSKLYMHRYFRYEVRIAESLIARNTPRADVEPDAFLPALARLFEPREAQQLAAFQALTRNLAIVTGGPGTGKTTVIMKILQVLLSTTEPDRHVIRLAAPTGKAAMRLMEAVGKAELPIQPEVQTLHRLLGMRGNGRSFRHGPDNPLPVSLLIVDEVSMVDLAMMHRLLAALPMRTQLILLGDAHQLPSVEAGNILGDICKYPAGYSLEFANRAKRMLDIDVPAGDTNHLLQDAVCRLTRSYRFSADRGIGRLSSRIRAGLACERITDDEVDTKPLAAIDAAMLAGAYDEFLDNLRRGNRDPETLIAAFEKTRILSPVREGNLGVTAINDTIEEELASRGLLDPRQRFYHGRPVLIVRNDYSLRLFNGDTGLCLRDPEDGEFKVVFRDSNGDLRSYLASRLPPHETCFAMTVHKSQGSEFDHVLLVLPDDVSGPTRHIMTRELVYTAVTRARRKITLFYDGDVLNDCLERHSLRHSGLGERFLRRDTSKQLDLFGPN